MKVFLIRHGEQLYPRDEQGRKLVSGPEAQLVELGRRQLRELGTALINEGEALDALYTSPLIRARQSTDELASVLGVTDIHVIEGLGETDPNSAEGKTYDELAERGGDIYAHPFGPQESLVHLVDRARSTAEAILDDAKKRGFESVGIVGHGDPLCALDWTLRHQNPPLSYDEMKNGFYPQKGEAYVYPISDEVPFRINGERRIIVTEAATQTLEGFRNTNREVK